jgi:hypothetical protein
LERRRGACGAGVVVVAGFASPAYVFFLLRGVAATASGCGLWASSQDSVVVSSPRSGLVCCLVQRYCSCRCRAAVRAFEGEGDGLAWSLCALCGLPPRTGAGAGAGARCSWVRVAGVVRLGGGYRGDGNKAVVDERATIYKAGFVWVWLAALHSSHCSSHLAFVRRAQVAACWPCCCFRSLSPPLHRGRSELSFLLRMGVAEQCMEVRGAANRR